ncbi:outer membrane efflux protein [Thermus thermophilus]|uniref:TolC family protein n=1 Tax=Thermus thermophilus TaxID=274 RepID=UPI00090B3A8F|nr:TolC family protein [Thermus thermophilus]BAW00746.1 outer membrane efflux protein [Thermus thermophilus]BDB11453.1 transporter [Thermus thermophilus]
MRKAWLPFLLAVAWAQGVDLKALVQGSPGFQDLEAERNQARLSLEAARAGLLPTLAPQGSYSRASTGQESLSLGVGGGFPLLPWGPAQDALQAAERAYRQALLDLRAQENALFLRVLSQYLEAYLAGLDLAVAQKALELREAQLQAVEAQYARGQATFQALLEAQTNQAQAQAEVLGAESALSLARARLQATLGTQVEPLPLPLPQVLPSLEEALAALERRPDVQKARLALEEAEALLAQARRDRYLPSVNLGVSLAEGQAGLEVRLDLKAGQLGYSLLLYPGRSQSLASFQLQANLPLFQPSQDAALSLREEAVERARRALANALVAAELDLKAKHQALRQAQSRLEVAARGLKAAESALDTARKRLAAGTGTPLEVKQAEFNLLQAQRSWEGAKAAFLQAYYALLEAMGESFLGGEK